MNKNKTNLAAHIAKTHNVPPSQALKIVESVFAYITDVLVSGEEYHQLGFGHFVPRQLKGRTIHNVHSREQSKIPPHIVLRLVPSRKINLLLNSKTDSRNQE